MITFPMEGVVFDVDGVLFDTENLTRRIWVEVSTEMGWPQVGEHYLEFVGRNRTDNFETMTRLFGPEFPREEFFFTCVDRLQAHMEREGVPMKPGARELMIFLQEHHIPMAIATSTAMVRTKRRMELTGLDQYLNAMITGDQVTRGKPDPEIYLLACQALGTDPTRTLAVEDSRNGILSATTAGMPTVMVPDLILPAPELEALLWQRCDSLCELQNILCSLLV